MPCEVLNWFCIIVAEQNGRYDMGTFSDVAELRIKILGDGAQKDMKTLKMSAKDIKDELLLMENAGLKNSKVYKDMKTLLSDVNMAAKSTLVNFDLQNASMTEMRAKKAALNAELNKLVVGSKEWMAKMGEIAPIAEKINQTREQINNFGKSVEVQESIWSKYGDWIKGAFAVTGIMELWQMLKGFAAGSLEEAKKFESAAQSLRGEVTMTDEQFKALKKSAEENGEAFGMTGEEMLKAYNAIASGKSDLIDVKGGIEAVTDAAIRLATNGEMELEESAKVMTSSLNQFGAEAKDAAKFVDILSTGTIVGAGKIQEMGSALKYVGPMAKAAGLSFSETNAALQILHQNGIKGEQAGTALRGMLSKLLKGANDTNPSIVGMSTAFDNLAKKQLSAKDMTELFGQEAVSAGIAIVSNNVKLKEWTATIEKGGGAAAMYAEKTKTVEFAEKQAAAAYANSRREIGEKLLPIWVSLINFFTQYGIPSIKAVATGIIGLIQGLAALPKFIVENKELFIGLGVALVSLNGANIAAAASALYMAAAEKTRAIATRAGVAAQWLMNAALTANPIGLVIAAIATLTGGIVWAYKNVNWFRAGIQATWAGLKEFVKVIWDVNMAFYKLDFSKAWERLKNGWSSVSKASGDAYSSAMAESNKRVAADTAKTSKATGEAVVKAAKDTGAKVMKIDEDAVKKRDRLKDEQLQKDEERFNELFEMQKDQVGRIKELEAEYIKWLEEFRKFRNKKINDAIDVIEKNFKNKEIAENKAHEKVIEDGKKGLANRIVKTHQDSVIKQQEANEAYVENYKKGLEYQSQALARWYAGLSNVQKQALDTDIGLIANFLGKQGQQIEEQINKTTDLYEKARLETKKQWIGVGQDALQTFDQMLNGNMVGSVIGVFKTLAGALDNWLMSNAREERARLEQELVLLKKAGEEFMENTKSLFTAEDVSNIKEIYGTLLKMVEVPPVRLDLGEYSTYEGRLQQELAIGASITANYNKAIEKENDLFDKAKENEELLFNDAIDKINKQYDAAIAGINKKYDWEQQMANRMFDQQSLGIQKQTNDELMALLNNNDTKLSLTSEFESKKAGIMAAFASQIKPITADMSQAEIDGINRATEARDAQLAKLEGWLTSELLFVINNEGQKRKEYSATDKIIEEGKERLNKLAIEQTAADIQRQTDRNIALAAAEAQKKTDTEAAEKVHLDTMEALAKGYNDRLTELGKAKDAALAESFRILNDIVKNGYDDMIAKALEAFNAGKITAQQYDEIASRLFNIKNMLGQVDWSKLTPPNFDWNFNIPRFTSGTDYVDPNDYWPDGTDTVPAMLNKGERVLTSGQNAAIGNMSNEELVRRLTSTYLSPSGTFYPVDRGLVDSISASGVPTMGGLSASMDNGGFSSWVSTNPAARSGGAASGGMGGFANPATRATVAMQGRGESGGDVAGALARNNELMQALVNLVANGTNEELKRIADKPNLTLHDVNLAKDKERDARVVSDF